MNAEGRPDGKRPFAHPSLLEYHKSRLYKYGRARWQRRRLQAQRRRLRQAQPRSLAVSSPLHLPAAVGDYSAVIRDAERNLTVFDFVSKHAENEELAWSLQQFRPQLLMVLDAGPPLRGAAGQGLRPCHSARRGRPGADPHVPPRTCPLGRRRGWPRGAVAGGLARGNPLPSPALPPRKLERALQDAVRSEDYEKAAKMRDALKNLKPAE